MFSKPNPSGYGFNDPLTSAQFNVVNDALPHALDGLNGGHYTLATILELDGAGVALEGTAHQVVGTLTVNSGGTLVLASGSLVNSPGASLTGTYTFGQNAGPGTNATVTVNTGSSLVLHSSVAVDNSTWSMVGTIVNMSSSGQINLAGTSTISVGATAGIVMSGTLSQAAGSHLDFASTADITGTALLKGIITNSGAGHIRKRITAGSTSSATYGVNNWDIVTLKGVTLTTNITYTITSTGAGEGSELIVNANGSTGGFLITLVRDDLTTIASLHPGTSGAFESIRLVFHSSAWDYCDASIFP